jgi:hypothetical protein
MTTAPYIPPNASKVIRSNRKNPPCGEADYFTSDETRNFLSIKHRKNIYIVIDEYKLKI